MVSISDIADGLTRSQDGVWRSGREVAVSFPSEGHGFCFEIEDRSFWFRHRNECIVAAMRAFEPAGPVFDIGAGNGCVSAALIGAGIEAVALEPGPEGAANARRRGLDPVICSTVENARFRKRSLSAVGLFDVIEHIQDDSRFLHRLSELMIDRGRLYVSVPAFAFLWSLEDDYAGHFRRYTVRSLNRLLEVSGFRPEFSSYFFAPLVLPAFVLRSVPSRLGFRRAFSPERARAEHSGLTGVGGTLLGALLSAETRRIRRGKPIPVGASCLVVASRRP
jgi:SAM-dependent methyltransferase